MTSLGELGALHVVAADEVRGDDLGRRTELGGCRGEVRAGRQREDGVVHGVPDPGRAAPGLPR